MPTAVTLELYVTPNSVRSEDQIYCTRPIVDVEFRGGFEQPIVELGLSSV